MPACVEARDKRRAARRVGKRCTGRPLSAAASKGGTAPPPGRPRAGRRRQRRRGLEPAGPAAAGRPSAGAREGSGGAAGGRAAGRARAARTPQRVGDGLRLEAVQQPLHGLHERLELVRVHDRALRAARAGRLQLGQAVQRGRDVDLVEQRHALAHHVQHLARGAPCF